MSALARPWVRLAIAAAAGAAAAGAVAGLLALAVIYGGLFDATADTPHIPVVAWAAHNAFKTSVRARADQAEPPPALTSDQLLDGVRVYDANCSACHGAPGVNRAGFAQAMIPTPPYLLDAARRWDRRQLAWIVDHGIKMTAMPAWGEVLPKDRIDHVVGFVYALPRLSPMDYARLRARALASAPPGRPIPAALAPAQPRPATPASGAAPSGPPSGAPPA